VKTRSLLGDIGLDSKIIFNWIFPEKYCDDRKYIKGDNDRFKLATFVFITLLNALFPSTRKQREKPKGRNEGQYYFYPLNKVLV
jgi:hypothetical protein